METKTTIDAGLEAVRSAKEVEAGQITIEQLAGSSEDRVIQKKMNEITNTIVETLEQNQDTRSAGLENIFSDVDNLEKIDFPIDRKENLYTSTLLLYKCKQTTLAPNQKKSWHADVFPGRVPDDASVITTEPVDVNFDYADLSYLRMLVAPGTWQSTGLYAPASENIVITVPDNTEHLDVQIGVHTDPLGHLPTWEREPIVALRQTLKPGINEISSPYGGLIYLIPTQSEEGKQETISISGAVKAPYFVSGETDVAKWNETIKHYPAPWAELQGEHVIHTIPSSLVRNLDTPDELMENWDTFVEQYNKLVGLSDDQPVPHRTPDRPHRYASDIQISAGFMHAGYPMMLTNEPSAPHIVDFDRIKDLHDGWGFWHEMGHEYQQVAWFWNDIVEVSVNIYSLYIQDFYNKPSRLLTKDKSGQTYYDIAFEFLDKKHMDKNFNEIGLFERLVMIRQLQMAYGWDFFTNLHRAYRELPEGALPDEDNVQQKIDTFVTMVSKVSGDNLLHFFDLWGMPYSKQAIMNVEDLQLPEPKEPLWTFVEDGEGPNKKT